MGVLEQFSLAGKGALVTGAARGLGQAIAVGLAEAGADLILLDRETLSDTKQIIEDLGRRCFCITKDLSQSRQKEAEAILGEVISHIGQLDILVNNAGIIRRLPTTEYQETDWQEVIDINLSSAFYLSQAIGRHFIEHGKRGKIINLASMLSFQGGYMVPSYTATTSALAGLTRALANEWAEFDINVNAIAPGYFLTEVTTGIRADPKRNQAVLDRIPAGRYGDPDELKGIAVFLASDASNYLHGSIIPVDGGWLAR
ncbi:MAG: 2-dehydro-3-deoxy-D-gluconate 5-dehydrogenase KduD [Saprospiraceae bacterium]|nr:2-dehydro-3-deoxy-D-gluconate 5-dehydrogenase KduD [Saprospiraceae bacterium]